MRMFCTPARQHREEAYTGVPSAESVVGGLNQGCSMPPCGPNATSANARLSAAHGREAATKRA
jgi:hypothetical protein